MGRFKRQVVCGLLAMAFVVGVLTAVAPPASATHWCQPLGMVLSPPSGIAGDRIGISITLTNNIGDALSVKNINVHFEWDPAQWSWGSMSLAAHSSETNTFAETLASVPGHYRVDLTVFGQAVGDPLTEKCFSTNSIVVVALPPPPTVIATANPTTGTAPLTVSFSATVSYGLGPFTYSWTFGDGGTGSGSSMSHSYASAGTYTAQVVVTDSRSRSVSDRVNVTVSQASLISPAGGGNTGPLLVIALLAVAAIAAAEGVAITLGRRKRTPPTQPPEQSPPQQGPSQ